MIIGVSFLCYDPIIFFFIAPVYFLFIAIKNSLINFAALEIFWFIKSNFCESNYICCYLSLCWNFFFNQTDIGMHQATVAMKMTLNECSWDKTKKLMSNVNGKFELDLVI